MHSNSLITYSISLDIRRVAELVKVKIYIFIYSKNVYSTALVWQKLHQAEENKEWQFWHLRSTELRKKLTGNYDLDLKP